MIWRLNLDNCKVFSLGDTWGLKWLVTDRESNNRSVLKDVPFGHTNFMSRQVVFGDRLTVALKCRTFYQEYLFLQDSWSLMAVASLDRLHCVPMDSFHFCTLAGIILLQENRSLLSYILYFYVHKHCFNVRFYWIWNTVLIWQTVWWK